MAEKGYELTPKEVDEHIETIASTFRKLMPEETEGMTDAQVIDFIITNVRITRE